MRPVSETPLLAQSAPRTFRGVTLSLTALIRQLGDLFRPYGYRLNRMLPKDGSEAMTGPIELSTTFDDYLVPGLFLAKGATPPDLETFRDGLKLLTFAGTGATVEEAFFTVHILHGMKPGSSPTFHIHWAHNQAAPSGNVKWQLEYTIAKGYGAGTYGSSVTMSTVQAAPAQYVHAITDDDDMVINPITEIEPDTVLICRIFRDPADAADTFEADAMLIHVDMHYERSTIGTPERNRPFTGF